ncbi:hypothetical protein H8E77_20645 [bacterium]|nr:hypothetical protein [bacterium]
MILFVQYLYKSNLYLVFVLMISYTAWIGKSKQCHCEGEATKQLADGFANPSGAVHKLVEHNRRIFDGC